MKVSSKIEICNLALARIGQNSIPSADLDSDTTPQGRFCRMNYEQSKTTLLSQYNWTFAITTASLPVLDNTGDALKQYAHKYALPDGFLRLVGVYDSANNEIIKNNNYKAPFLLEGSYVYCDVPDIILKYVQDVDQVDRFSPMFIDCFVLDLAIRLTKLFNDSGTYLQQLQLEFAQTLPRAKINDCQQTSRVGIRSYPILQSTWGF